MPKLVMVQEPLKESIVSSPPGPASLKGVPQQVVCEEPISRPETECATEKQALTVAAETAEGDAASGRRTNRVADEGHNWLQQRVRRKIESGGRHGGPMGAEDADPVENPALWHIEYYDDNDAVSPDDPLVSTSSSLSHARVITTGGSGKHEMEAALEDFQKKNQMPPPPKPPRKPPPAQSQQSERGARRATVARMSFEVGDKVQAFKWSEWHDATILEVRHDSLHVHYFGWCGERHDDAFRRRQRGLSAWRRAPEAQDPPSPESERDADDESSVALLVERPTVADYMHVLGDNSRWRTAEIVHERMTLREARVLRGRSIRSWSHAAGAMGRVGALRGGPPIPMHVRK